MDTRENTIQFSVWRWRFAVGLAVLVVGLIFKGALVTSHDAGLAVPDWPTSFGENMFAFPPSKWRGIIFFEHVHRLYASLVGLLTVVLAVWLHLTPQRPWVRRLSVVAVVLVIAQGVLGGLTVLFLLPVAISSGHALLGQTFLLVTIALAYSQSREVLEGRAAGATQPTDGTAVFSVRALVALVLVIYVQLLIGAVMRHSEAGIAILDFPTMVGKWLPSLSSETLATLNASRAELGLPQVSSWQVALHLFHRGGGVLVLVVVGLAFLAGRAECREGTLPKATWNGIRALVAVGAVQFGLGALTVLTMRHPWIASLHVALGAVMLGGAFLVLLRALCGSVAAAPRMEGGSSPVPQPVTT